MAASLVVLVLVGTRSPGNLGAVCRVAKAFGFPRVALVAPRVAPGEAEARRLAHGAEDVLEAVESSRRFARRSPDARARSRRPRGPGTGRDG